VISVVLANIVLTDLSQACKNQDEDKMTAILQKASKWVLLFSLPSMIGGFFLSEIIVATLFKSDNFTIYDVSACATAFQLLSLAIPFLMFVRVWNVVPYALSKPQELLKITMISFVMSSSITLILLPKFQYLAICVGILFGGVSNACQLYYYVQKIINEPLFDAAFVKNSIYASLAMASVLLLMNILFPTSIIEDKWTLLYNLFFRSLLSLSAWFLCLRTDQIRMLKD
jgi:putative peptidoglycan lipid II flippase